MTFTAHLCLLSVTISCLLLQLLATITCHLHCRRCRLLLVAAQWPSLCPLVAAAHCHPIVNHWRRPDDHHWPMSLAASILLHPQSLSVVDFTLTKPNTNTLNFEFVLRSSEHPQSISNILHFFMLNFFFGHPKNS